MSLLLALTLLALPAAAKLKGPDLVVVRESGFACEAPKGWKLQSYEKGGALWLGPRSKDSPAPKISIEYYAAGGRQFADAEAYLKSRTETGPVTEVEVAGHAAKTFTRKLSRFLPPHSLDARAVVVIEERIVVPGKAGFHVLAYSAPEPDFKTLRPGFQRFVDTFRALPSP